MRRLIRHLGTGHYFLHGKWTPNADEAQTFESAKEAVDTAFAQSLSDVELVLQFGPKPSPLYDSHHPLRSANKA